MIMINGGLVDAASFMPNLISHSTGEAEYSTAAMALMACSHVKKVYNELHSKAADTLLTVPLGIDSKAADDIASSERETKRTRHMQRRFHYFRECTQNGSAKIFRIPGEQNWSNNLTKPVNGPQADDEAKVFQIDVPP